MYTLITLVYSIWKSPKKINLNGFELEVSIGSLHRIVAANGSIEWSQQTFELSICQPDQKVFIRVWKLVKRSVATDLQLTYFETWKRNSKGELSEFNNSTEFTYRHSPNQLGELILQAAFIEHFENFFWLRFDRLLNDVLWIQWNLYTKLLTWS